jgi:3-oxoacyl-[acyl-carrier-protein] synthase-3
MLEFKPAPQLVMSGLAYDLGTETPIASLPELKEDPDLETTLRHLGLGSYRASPFGVTELASRACAETLRQTRIDPADVEALVFTTMSLRSAETYRKGFRALHAGLGLRRAMPLGIFGAECADLPLALRVAADMILARGLSNVLVVTSDVAGTERRLMDGMVSVFSDGAASCLLSGKGVRGYAIEAIAHHCSIDMWDVDPRTNLMAHLKGGTAGSAEAVRRALSESGTQPADYQRLLTGNYNRSVLRTFASQLGFADEQMFADNVARVGHAYSADTLINLKNLRAAGGLADGERALMLGSGPNAWGVTAVRALSREID